MIEERINLRKVNNLQFQNIAILSINTNAHKYRQMDSLINKQNICLDNIL